MVCEGAFLSNFIPYFLYASGDDASEIRLNEAELSSTLVDHLTK